MRLPTQLCENREKVTMKSEWRAKSFNEVFPRLRVSVCHACQLRCLFCHREGIANHWRPLFFDLRSFELLIEAYQGVDGREMILTGGEPTLHPYIGELLRIAGCQRRWRLLLHTNGLAMDRVLPALRAGLIDEVRVSLHTTDDAYGRRFLGAGWSFKAVSANILAARNCGVAVTVVFTYSPDTARFLADVVRFADAAGVSLLVVDLIGTRWMRVRRAAKGRGLEDVLETMLAYAEVVDFDEERGGCRLLNLQSRRGCLWQIKDMNFGRTFAPACAGCTLRPECGEGVYALRVDAGGIFRPCLLRSDLERSLSVPFESKDAVIDMFKLMLRLMAQAPLASPRAAAGELVNLEPVTRG